MFKDVHTSYVDTPDSTHLVYGKEAFLLVCKYGNGKWNTSIIGSDSIKHYFEIEDDGDYITIWINKTGLKCQQELSNQLRNERRFDIFAGCTCVPIYECIEGKIFLNITDEELCMLHDELLMDLV